MECSSGFESSTALPKGASMEETAGQSPALKTRNENEINPPTIIMDNNAPKHIVWVTLISMGRWQENAFQTWVKI